MTSAKDRSLPWSASGVVDELRARRDEARQRRADVLELSPATGNEAIACMTLGESYAYEEAAQLIEACSDPRAFGPVLEQLRLLHRDARTLGAHLADGPKDDAGWAHELGRLVTLVGMASAEVDAALAARTTLPERLSIAACADVACEGWRNGPPLWDHPQAWPPCADCGDIFDGSSSRCTICWPCYRLPWENVPEEAFAARRKRRLQSGWKPGIEVERRRTAPDPRPFAACVQALYGEAVAITPPSHVLAGCTP